MPVEAPAARVGPRPQPPPRGRVHGPARSQPSPNPGRPRAPRPKRLLAFGGGADRMPLTLSSHGGGSCVLLHGRQRRSPQPASPPPLCARCPRPLCSAARPPPVSGASSLRAPPSGSSKCSRLGAQMSSRPLLGEAGCRGDRRAHLSAGRVALRPRLSREGRRGGTPGGMSQWGRKRSLRISRCRTPATHPTVPGSSLPLRSRAVGMS